MGREALVCAVDISKLADIERTVDQAVKAFGRIDILVNNFGIAGEVPVGDMTPGKYEQVMGVNLKSHVFCTQYKGL